MTQGSPPPATRLEDLARHRLRTLRLARGWTLDDLAQRANTSPSTISRIETGHRRLAIDQLVDLARALDTTVDDLLRGGDDEDVVIRPSRGMGGRGAVHWPLTRLHDPSGRTVAKMRIPATKRTPEPRVHPGREWFLVLEGTARLVLGDREHLVPTGHAAEFDTMTPHAISGWGGPVEVLTIFDRLGEAAHLRPPSAVPRATSGR